LAKFAPIFYTLIFLLPILLISAEQKEYPNTPATKEEAQNQEQESDIYSEYKNVQESLWKDYQKLREELVNGYLTGKLKIKYEEFKMRQQALIEKYIEGKNKLLQKYFDEKSATQNQNGI
jgi:hypothetical protein